VATGRRDVHGGGCARLAGAIVEAMNGLGRRDAVRVLGLLTFYCAVVR